MRSSSPRSLGTLVGLTLAVLLSGCGSRGDKPEMATVSGRLTLDGKPLAGYIVTFQPTSGRPSVCQAPTDADGRFELWYTFKEKGAKVDKHKVMLAFSPADDKSAMDAQSGVVSGDAKKIAELYGTADKTTLEFNVTENTTEANLDIKLE